MTQTKPFPITRGQGWEAYQRVKANQGGAGVDGQTVAEFEEGLENHLYKLWNRLASGSYRPPPFKRGEIPKVGGGGRPLGIPTRRNIYVRTPVAGERVMRSVTRFLEQTLKLKVNAKKSAVACVDERPFLGYRLRDDGTLAVASQSLAGVKAKIRQITRRTRGVSLSA